MTSLVLCCRKFVGNFIHNPLVNGNSESISLVILYTSFENTEYLHHSDGLDMWLVDTYCHNSCGSYTQKLTITNIPLQFFFCSHSQTIIYELNIPYISALVYIFTKDLVLYIVLKSPIYGNVFSLLHIFRPLLSKTWFWFGNRSE